MIIRGATLFGRMAVLFVFFCALTACGGGGGGDGGGFLPGSNDLKMTLFDPNGDETNSVTDSAPGTLRVKVGSQGNVVVTAETDIGTLIPASGSALTDSSGIATFQIEAGGEKGAGTITATAITGSSTLTGTLSFQVGDSGLRLGYFDEDGTFLENQIFIEPKSTLAAGGNAQFTVVVLNSEGQRVTTGEEVRFNSGCIASGQSLINPEVPQATNGQASTLYTAAGCAGIDEISASVVGAAAQAFGSLKVAAPEANAINFESATPQLIVLRGTGGGDRDETADVLFTVVDGSGSPLSGITVNFSLSTTVGGLSLSTTTALSNGDGQIQVTVQAGDVATVVRVIASIDDGSGEVVSTVSDLLTVTTGLPDQNSISLSVGPCGGGGDGGGFVVEEGMKEDGVCRSLNVRMADKFNNPVVDGTAAIFTTEYGVIVGSCSTTGGVCSVEWTSQEPRFPTLTGAAFIKTIKDADYDCPDHRINSGPCPSDLGFTRGGRSTILVTAIGEESFIDSNGNGVMDQPESALFENLPEAFIDHNEDGIYTPADPVCIGSPNSDRCIAGQEETFVDFNSNETYDLNNTPPVYNGLLCPPEGDGVWCSRELINVRDDTVVILSNEPPFHFLLVNGAGNIPSVLNSGERYEVYISDLYNNPPGLGSSISFATKGNCELVRDGSEDIFNLQAPGAYVAFVSVKTTNEEEPESGSLSFTLTSSSGNSFTSEAFSCRPGIAPPTCEDDPLTPLIDECADDTP